MRSTTVIKALYLAGFALCIVRPATTAAQQTAEAGVARERKTGKPLECLHVALIDSAGNAITHAVTDSAGQFLLEAPRPGAYRVRFDLNDWEPLVGPLDTLAEGETRPRAYPLTFATRLVPEDASPEVYRQFRARYGTWTDSASWSSASLIPGNIGMQYPTELRAAYVSGKVVSQFIVDPNGIPRPGSWQPIEATHMQFQNAVKSSLRNRRFNPAKLAGQPSCELIRDVTMFNITR